LIVASDRSAGEFILLDGKVLPVTMEGDASAGRRLVLLMGLIALPVVVSVGIGCSDASCSSTSITLSGTRYRFAFLNQLNTGVSGTGELFASLQQQFISTVYKRYTPFELEGIRVVVVVLVWLGLILVEDRRCGNW